MKRFLRQMVESMKRFYGQREARRLLLLLISMGLLSGLLFGIFYPHQEEGGEEVVREEEPDYEGRILNILLENIDLTRLQLPQEEEELEGVMYPFRAHTTPEEELHLSHSYLWSMHPPYKGEVMVEFGWYRHSRFLDWRYNPGLTYRGEEGPVLATMGGRVVEVRENSMTSYDLLLHHGSDLTTYYKELEEVFVEYGQVVERGEPIAYPSTNGLQRVFSFQLLEGNTPLDPSDYLYQGK